MIVYLAVLGAILYLICAVCIVPTRDFLIDYLLSETMVVQQKSLLRPKWHTLSDSVQEMVVVGRDTVEHR